MDGQGNLLIDPPFFEMDIAQIENALDLRSLFDPENGELVTDDRNPLEPWNEVQNRTLRDIVFDAYRPIFLGE